MATCENDWGEKSWKMLSWIQALVRSVAESNALITSDEIDAKMILKAGNLC